LHAIKALDSLDVKGDVAIGVDIIRRSLVEPTKHIADNAGTEGSIVVRTIIDKGEANYGFNAQTEEYGDLVQQGVIDPTKVVRSALENAASVASLLLTTEAMVAEKPESKKSDGSENGHSHYH